MGLLTQVFPPALVSEVIAQTGRTERRSRLLPARSMAYFVIGMGLYADGSYEEVWGQMADGLSWVSGGRENLTLPSKSAIFQARHRLGPEPLEALFARVAKPLGTARTAGAWLAGRRLVAVDNTYLDLQDTPLNVAFFGRPGVGKDGKPRLPQARLVALAECGTQVIFDAVVGACTSSEVALATELIERLEPGMLLLADRATCSYRLWQSSFGTGADLLWRVNTGLSPKHLETLGDGSWLAVIHPAVDDQSESITLRVVDCPAGDGTDDLVSCQLFTTILDTAQASADDLIGAYDQRWRIRLTLDELTTHQRGSRRVLRSKSPELVLQEIWGYLCCHYAIRTLMTGAATHSSRTTQRTSAPSLRPLLCSDLT